jgi:hypothetical protein
MSRRSGAPAERWMVSGHVRSVANARCSACEGESTTPIPTRWNCCRACHRTQGVGDVVSPETLAGDLLLAATTVFVGDAEPF